MLQQRQAVPVRFPTSNGVCIVHASSADRAYYEREGVPRLGLHREQLGIRIWKNCNSRLTLSNIQK